MRSGDHPIREARASDVQIHQAMAAESLHELALQGRHPLLFRVRAIPFCTPRTRNKRLLLVFNSTLLFGLVNLQSHTIPLTSGTWWYSMLSVVSCVPVFTLTSRFILNMRALYARDVRNRGGSEIDTGFGLSSLSNPGVGGTAIVFADAGLDDGALRDEEMSTKNGEEEFTGNQFEC